MPISNDAIVELVSRIKPVSEMMERETDLGVATEFENHSDDVFIFW